LNKTPNSVFYFKQIRIRDLRTKIK
jgi:hypothetical protein